MGTEPSDETQTDIVNETGSKLDRFVTVVVSEGVCKVTGFKGTLYELDLYFKVDRLGTSWYWPDDSTRAIIIRHIAASWRLCQNDMSCLALQSMLLQTLNTSEMSQIC